MPRIFRIHGDNIVECERIANLIFEETAPTSVEISLMSPSTIVYNLQFHYLGHHFAWRLELLPGFNKAQQMGRQYFCRTKRKRQLS